MIKKKYHKGVYQPTGFIGLKDWLGGSRTFRDSGATEAEGEHGSDFIEEKESAERSGET